MFARLFGKSGGNAQTAYSEISKVITGAITNPANLTSTTFDTTNSIIINNQSSNWSEYTTIGSNNLVTIGSVIWLRQRSKSGVWKYAGIFRNATGTHKGIFRAYTGESPTIPSGDLTLSTAGNLNSSATYGSTIEYTIAAGPRYLIIATKLTTQAYFTEVHMWLEYPENNMYNSGLSPNHIMYRHYTTGTEYSTDAYTDINFSTGIVEYCLQNSGMTILRGGLGQPTTQTSTMKPSYYTTSVNTRDSSGNFIAYPILPLFSESLYQGFLNCSSLTSVMGVGSSIGNYGDTVVVDGREYVFLKANASLSYLIPKK